MILETFFEPHRKDPSKCVNERQEKERTKLKQKSKKRSQAGIESGRKRREMSRLRDEQMFNKTRTKTNIPIPIPIPISKEEKEKKEDTPQAASTTRGTRIPDEFLLTPEMRTWAERKRPGIDPALETEKFCNYWRAKSGRDAAKLDWRATWNNWILNARLDPSAPIPRSVGKNLVEDGEPDCPDCRDAKEIARPKINGHYDWEVEFIPCPRCTIKQAVSV